MSDYTKKKMRDIQQRIRYRKSLIAITDFNSSGKKKNRNRIKVEENVFIKRPKKI